MKYILSLLLYASICNASYSLSYSGIKLGEIKSFSTIKDNYFEVKVTSVIVKFILGYDYIIFYNEKFKNKKDKKNTQYKNDKYKIIDIFNVALYKNINKKHIIKISDKKYIEILKNKDFSFKYFKNKKVKTYGNFKVVNKELIYLEELSKGVKIQKED